MLSTTIRMNNNSSNQEVISNRRIMVNKEIMVARISIRATKINTMSKKICKSKIFMIIKIREDIRTTKIKCQIMVVKTKVTITKLITWIKDNTKVIRKAFIKDKVATIISILKHLMISNILTSTKMIIKHKGHIMENIEMTPAIPTTTAKMVINITEDKIVINTIRIMKISTRILKHIKLVRKNLRFLHPKIHRKAM